MTENQAARILIADDDPEDIELIEDAILQIAPATELLKFSNGRMVLEFLDITPAGELPGLVILDYNMPELTGAEVLSYMKAQDRFRAIPKIVLSTSNSSLYIHECISNGAMEYIVKPDNVGELQTLAKKLLALCKPTSQ